jgi:hypothetical protein
VVGLAGFAAGVLSEENGMDAFLGSVIGPLVTLAAAFFGAWYAFKLHDEKDKRSRSERDVMAANRAIFEISRHCNRLATFRKRFLDEKKDDSNRDYSVLPVAGFSWDFPNIDYDSLAFLFESSQPNLLTEMSSVEQAITSAVDVIRQRSEFHVEKLQPVVEELEKEHGPSFPVNLICSKLGPKDSQVLRMLTDYNYECVDTAISEMEKVIKKLAEEVKEIRPGHVVISFKLPSTE